MYGAYDSRGPSLVVKPSHVISCTSDFTRNVVPGKRRRLRCSLLSESTIGVSGLLRCRWTSRYWERETASYVRRWMFCSATPAVLPGRRRKHSPFPTTRVCSATFSTINGSSVTRRRIYSSSGSATVELGSLEVERVVHVSVFRADCC